MDVSKWGLGRIMQLPDHCFGSRWPVGLAVVGSPAAGVFDITELALPEVCVIWELSAWYDTAELGQMYFELRLGDMVPTTWAEFQLNELLFRGVRYGPGVNGYFHITSMTSIDWRNLKMPVQSAGRRVILGVPAGVAIATRIQVVITVSSIPREVPDCLLSV